MSLIEFSNFPIYSNFLSFGREKFCKNIKFELSPKSRSFVVGLGRDGPKGGNRFAKRQGSALMSPNSNHAATINSYSFRKRIVESPPAPKDPASMEKKRQKSKNTFLALCGKRGSMEAARYGSMEGDTRKVEEPPVGRTRARQRDQGTTERGAGASFFFLPHFFSGASKEATTNDIDSGNCGVVV